MPSINDYYKFYNTLELSAKIDTVEKKNSKFYKNIIAQNKARFGQKRDSTTTDDQIIINEEDIIITSKRKNKESRFKYVSIEKINKKKRVLDASIRQVSNEIVFVSNNKKQIDAKITHIAKIRFKIAQLFPMYFSRERQVDGMQNVVKANNGKKI